MATSAIVIFTGLSGAIAQETAKSVRATLPTLEVHPLPQTLSDWTGDRDCGDYFSEIKITPVGYLVWSEFPVTVYFDRPSELEESSPSNQIRFQQWVDAVVRAIAEWNAYLPLIAVEERELADIVIERSPPPIGSTLNLETGELEIPRARSAQTRYKFYLTSSNPPRLSHRMTIQINPGLSQPSTLSAIRHELGHALGIWGHSLDPADVLYFSQVQTPPAISARDISTLKKIYQQPTRLGWIVPNS